MTITYRTSGAWGPGKGGNLTAAEVDTNFYTLVQDIAQVADDLVPAEIENITLVGSQLTFVLSDARTFGPFTVPSPAFRWVGDWEPDELYLANDVLSTPLGVYLVVQNHTSAAIFDPAREIGGNPVYALMFASPPPADFVDLGDTPADYADAAGKLVAVNATEDGLEFIAAPSGSFEGLDDTPADYAGAAGKLVAVNGTEDGLEFVDAPSGSFEGLDDTPADYADAAGKLVAVNSTEDGLEFVDPPAGSFDALDDTPADYTGAAGKIVAVNGTENGLEFIDAPSGGGIVILAVLDSTSDLPGSGTAGDAYVIDGDLWVWDTIEEDWANAGSFAGPDGAPGPIALVDLKAEDTANYTVQESDLDGNVIRRINSSSNLTVTIPSGLVGTEPFTVVRKGSGTVTFVAGSGVTINSADNALAIARRYASAIVIPEGSDVYLLIGDLS
jgi:hypothetical protein